MLNRVRLWIGSKLRMCIEQILILISGFIALILACYGTLTIDIRVARWKIYKLLPCICSYNKRMIAFNVSQRNKPDYGQVSQVCRGATEPGSTGITG